jgi:hypothetical protein
LCFWTLSIILFLFKTHNFRRPDSVFILWWNLLSWTQSIQLIPISGHQHQHKIEYINQAQHKPSARVKTNIKNPNITYRKYKESAHVSGRSSDQSTHPASTSLPSGLHNHSRSQQTTTLSSVDYVWKLCYYISTIERIFLFSMPFCMAELFQP